MKHQILLIVCLLCLSLTGYAQDKFRYGSGIFGLYIQIHVSDDAGTVDGRFESDSSERED